MGGFSSGRRNGRPKVEDALRLSIKRLRGFLSPDGEIGTIKWSVRGRQIAEVTIGAILDGEHGHLWLVYSTRERDGSPRDVKQQINLTSRPMRFGGLRWYFVCPKRAVPCNILYAIGRPAEFLSREAHGLGYSSQRETVRYRDLSRLVKLQEKLGGPQADVGVDAFNPKPKWMRIATYERLLEQIFAAQEAVESHLVS